MGQRRSIEGSRILITGASQGIGRALALEAARRGAKVLAAARAEGLLAGVGRGAAPAGHPPQTGAAHGTSPPDPPDMARPAVHHRGGRHSIDAYERSQLNRKLAYQMVGGGLAGVIGQATLLGSDRIDPGGPHALRGPPLFFHHLRSLRAHQLDPPARAPGPFARAYFAGGNLQLARFSIRVARGAGNDEGQWWREHAYSGRANDLADSGPAT